MVKRMWTEQSTRLVRIGVMAAGLIFLVAGLLRGEAIQVLKRAIIICLGCIGID
jgi:hypothetical protein